MQESNKRKSFFKFVKRLTFKIATIYPTGSTNDFPFFSFLLYFLLLSDKGPTLETLDFTIRTKLVVWGLRPHNLLISHYNS